MKRWMPLPVAEYTPDMPAFNNPGSSNIRNCIPRTPISYGPITGFAEFGGALTKDCQGAAAFSDINGTSYIFAGDENDLYEYTSSSTNPVTVSNGTSPYNVDPTGQGWDFELMGQTVIATDYNDAMQSFILGTSTKFSDLANGNIRSLIVVGGAGYTNGTNYALTASGGGGSGFAGLIDVVSGHLTNARITTPGHGFTSVPTIAVPAGAGAGSGGSITPTISTIAPTAKYIAVIKNFLVAAFTSDAINGIQDQRVWWSALNDPTNWPTPGSATAAEFQSSFNDLLGNYGQITGLVGALGTADGAVFFQRAVWRIIYGGPPVVFEFFPCETIRGTSMPNSIVKRGLLVDYIGEDGFYTFDGTSSIPIGANKIDKTFFADLDQNHINNVVGAADPVNRLTIWAYPGQGNNMGIPNRLIFYNWILNRFSIADIPLGIQFIFRALTFGFTLDTMPGGTLDQIDIPLDSNVWSGGSIIMGGFNVDNKLGYFNGTTLAALIESGEKAPFDNMLAHITDTRPLIDGGTPTVSIATRNRLLDTASYNSGSGINSIGTCPQIANGRYIRSKTQLLAGDSWQHFQGVEVYTSPNGSQ